MKQARLRLGAGDAEDRHEDATILSCDLSQNGFGQRQVRSQGTWCTLDVTRRHRKMNVEDDFTEAPQTINAVFKVTDLVSTFISN